MGEKSRSESGRRIVKVSYAMMEAWFRGETIQCITPLPQDAKLIGVRKGVLDTVELSFESAEWPDIVVGTPGNVFPEIIPIFQGMMVCVVGE